MNGGTVGRALAGALLCVVTMAGLIVGFHAGYRTAWLSQRGGVAGQLVEANRTRWSGEGSGFDAAISGGMLLSSRRVAAESPSLLDIAPTVLRYFGVPVPEDLEGAPLY